MKKMGQLMIGLVGSLFLSTLLVLGQAMPCHAQAKLVGSDAVPGDIEGFSVSASGDRVVVGAPIHESAKGAAYVFWYDGSAWIEEAKLIADDGAASDFFGSSISISGDTIVVGASGDDYSQGSAYVFRYEGSSWTQEAKLVASDGAAPDNFGCSVAINGDTIVVGAFGKNDFTGVAYVYRHGSTGWAEEATLTPVDGVPGDLFGMSVSMSGNKIVVGSPYGDANDLAPDSGAAYVFRRDGAVWTQEAKLVAGDPDFYDSFGASVSISGSKVVVGAPSDDASVGSAYVFKYDGIAWIQEAKLVASGPPESDRFGASVSISGNRIVIGVPEDDDKGENSGSAYVFKFDGTRWGEEIKLTASDGASYDYFGPSISISENTIVIGATGATGDEEGTGAAYVFTLEEESIELYVDIKPDSCVNPLNPKSQGVLPVAILGTESFDVKTIDPRSIRLSREGVDGEVAPIRGHYGDVGKPNQCEPVNATCYESLRDGYRDLILMFKTQQLVGALQLWDVAGETVTLTLTANLKEEFGGTALSAQDDIKVLGKKPKPKPPKKPKK